MVLSGLLKSDWLVIKFEYVLACTAGRLGLAYTIADRAVDLCPEACRPPWVYIQSSTSKFVRMDEKNASAMDISNGRRSPLPLYQKQHNASFFAPSERSRLRSRLVVYIVAFTSAFLIITYGMPILSGYYPQASPETIMTQSTDAKSNQTALVPLEAHIMSKCPDAKTCLEKLVVPAMEQVVDMVNFRLSYIGSVDDNDTLRTYSLEIRS